ncbi:MAG: hypothetical protein QXN52_08525 [Nitrososphaerota archaeon]
MGNAIWKEAFFSKSITLNEAMALMDVINSVLNRLPEISSYHSISPSFWKPPILLLKEHRRPLLP